MINIESSPAGGYRAGELSLCWKRKIFGQIENGKIRLFRVGYRITGSAFGVRQITDTAGAFVHQMRDYEDCNSRAHRSGKHIVPYLPG